MIGCAENAVFDLVVELPAPSGAITHAIVRFQTDGDFAIPSDADWASASDAEPALLADGEVGYSIVGSGEHIAAPLGMRVRFCETPECGLDVRGRSSVHQARFDRVFFLGRRTRHRYSIGVIPAAGSATAIDEVDKCEIAGCVEGELTSWCRADGAHVCEP